MKTKSPLRLTASARGQMKSEQGTVKNEERKMMPKSKHGVKPCPLTKGGMERAPGNAPVCKYGRVCFSKPGGRKEGKTAQVSFLSSLFIFLLLK